MFVQFYTFSSAETIQAAAEAWLTESRETHAPRTIIRRAASLASFSKMFDLDIDLDDYRLPPAPPVIPHPLPDLARDVEKMLAKASGPTQIALVAFGAFGGLRISETLAVMPEDINDRTRKLSVEGKGGKIREVPISPALWKHILPALILAKANGTNLVPLEDRNARGIISRIARRAGIKSPVSSHDLRATFATLVYKKTNDVRLVQYLLGHANINTTQVYLGIDHKGAVDAVDFDD